MTIEISFPNQEEIILQYLLAHHSASTFELQELGVKNPSCVIRKLVDKYIPICGYNVETHRVGDQIIYSHYRYILDKRSAWGGAV